MRHAFVGAGGIGGLLAAALARSGADVVLLMRPESLARYGGRLIVESVVLGDFEVGVPAVSGLDSEVDVLWLTTKATQLDPALALAPAEVVGDAVASAAERRRPRPAASEVLSECRSWSDPGGIGEDRYGPNPSELALPARRTGRSRCGSCRSVWGGGIECRVRDDALSMLWEKLAVLAPIALATTALDGPLGSVRDDERYRACQGEVLAVGGAEGAKIDRTALRELVSAAPDEMRSSMQKDVAAGRQPELDAIAGPILREGRRHGIPVPGTADLAALVAAKAGEQAYGV